MMLTDYLLLYGVVVPVLAAIALASLLGGARHRGYQPKEPITGPPYTPDGYYRDATWCLHKREES